MHTEYILLRQTTDLVPEVTPGSPPMVAVKFFPVKDSLGLFVTYFSDSPEAAWSEVAHAYPFLRHSLAIQPKDEYDRTVERLRAHLLASRGKTPGVLRSDEGKRPAPKS